MSGISDSEVTFAERCKRYGLSQEHVDDLKQKGVATYGQLLFRVASGPNQVDDNKLSDLLSACRPNLTDSGKSAIKRLVFEAGTFVVAELKDAISSPGVEGVKRLTPQERDSRFNAVQQKLGSFALTGPYEPAHSLVDSCSGMVAAQCITRIPPSRCASREQEVATGKREEHLLRLESTALKLASKPQPLKVDVSSELRISQALTRRGVALEMSGVCSFQEHEAYSRSLLAHAHRYPPPGYQAPSIDQLLRADRELWVRISETVGHQFGGTLGTTPVDEAIKSLKDSPQVLFHLHPMPLPPKPDKLLPLKRAWYATQEGKGKGKQEKGKGKGKGKLKGKGKGSGGQKVQTNVPAPLKGLGPNFQGEPICFDHSLPHGCQLETWDTALGPSCRKGLHLCMKCHGPHSASGCDK